jgi:hypothetical protein
MNVFVKAAARRCRTFGVGWARRLRTLLLAVAFGGLGVGAPAQSAAPGSAADLLAKRVELQAQLRASPFGEPLVMRTRELADRVEGDVYADLAYPFATVAATFSTPAGICELLFLHLNVRGCLPSTAPAGDAVTVLVGPKRAGAFDTEYRMHYAMRTEVAAPTHRRVTLSAPRGPLSTRDYRIVFEVVPIDGEHSFVHFGYAYGFGTLARMAMGAYLATAGRAKIGFTVEGADAGGKPIYVRGERAALERNVMRYYLALLACLSVSSGSPEEQLQARLRAWFALTERYAPQLHEYDLAEYLHEKNDQLAHPMGPK